MRVDPASVISSGASIFRPTDYRHDFFGDVQRAVNGVSDIPSGKSRKFLDRAYGMQTLHDEDRLRDMQDSFKEDDVINNTPGRGVKNYRRMEYDMEVPSARELSDERIDGIYSQKVWGVKELVKAIRGEGYTICTTASAVSSSPITKKDYEGQIKLH